MVLRHSLFTSLTIISPIRILHHVLRFHSLQTLSHTSFIMAEPASSAKDAQDAFELEKRQIRPASSVVDIAATHSSIDLTDNESDNKAIVELDKNGKPIPKPEPKISYLKLYRFASPFDLLCVWYISHCSLPYGTKIKTQFVFIQPSTY